MNREEAAREIDNTACCFSDKRFRDAMHMAADALRREQEEREMTQNQLGSTTTQLCPECKTPMPIEAQLTELCRLANINIRVCDLLKTALALLAGGREMKVCIECRKRLKVGDWQSSDADDGYCKKCLSTMSINDLTESLAVNQVDILEAFEYYPIRRADK